MGLHVYPPIQEELHSLTLQEATLGARISDSKVRAAGPTVLDDPMAGDASAVGVAMHRPPHDPGRPGRPEHPSDLAVSSHASTGDPGHKGIDPGEKAGLLPRGCLTAFPGGPRSRP